MIYFSELRYPLIYATYFLMQTMNNHFSISENGNGDGTSKMICFSHLPDKFAVIKHKAVHSSG